MSYGHADKIAQAGRVVRQETPRPPIDPALYRREDVRRVLAVRDVAALYRLVGQEGISQRQIAELVGQSQSEVSEIMKGRRVTAYDLLERIALRLGIPRELMGLSYGEQPPSGGGTEGTEGVEVDDDMQRRDALAVGFMAALGAVPPFAKLLDSSAAPKEVPLPSRLGTADVAEVRQRTQELRLTAQTEGGQARAANAAAASYRRLTAVPAAEAVTRSLGSALAELEELAGWCCYDAGLDRHARWHYRTAVNLAHRVGDTHRAASALRYAGVVDANQGEPNQALKLYQVAGLMLGKQDPDISAWLYAVSARVLAEMEHEQAADYLNRARDGWQATEPAERADQDYQTAVVYVRLSKLDRAEALTASVNGIGRHRPVGTFAKILRATIHVRTGEPGGAHMAHEAVGEVARLRSLCARKRLIPLIEELESRPSSSDAGEVARLARKVVAA